MNQTCIPGPVRFHVRLRARGRCEDCGDKTRIELHHLRYSTDDGTSIRGRETPDDLAALCRDCHHARHVDPAGVFWVDPQEMAEHWAGYHHEMAKP